MTEKAKNVRLWQEIALALAFKSFLLAIIWVVWFLAPEDITLTDQKVASQILSQQYKSEHDHDANPRAR